MAKRENLATAVGNEVIMYGGIPMRRRDVYALIASEDSDDKKLTLRKADYFAFNPSKKVLTNVKPWSLASARELFGEQ